MKVIIGCLNSKYIHMSSAPWCLAAGVREFAKTDVCYEVLESTVNNDLDHIAAKIIASKPDVVSFCCYIWNITQTLDICKSISSTLGCNIVLGGPEVAYRARDILKQYQFIDFVLSGEGEFCFPVFLDMLNGAYTKDQVPGLTFRKNDDIVSIPEKSYTETPPSPFDREYFDALKGRICYIESSRGCPYRCAFCLSGRLSSFRLFDIETTKRDILKLANSGTQTIKFVDRTFNAIENHANEILEFIKQNYSKQIPKGVCFHFEIAGDILKESTIKLLSQMPYGSVQLEIGIQSFNEYTLLAINRKTDTGKLIDNIKKLISFNNMHIHIDLIAGLTGEDISSFEKSFDIGYSLHAHMLQMGFLKLLYGADMREHPEKYPCDFSDAPPYQIESTPWLTPDEVTALKNCEDALDRLYNSGRYLFTLDYLINEVGITPFKLFFDFGNTHKGDDLSLCDYTLAVYSHFKNLCDGDILKEKLICDLICCASATQIPKSFKTNDPLYKKAKALLSKNENVKIAVLCKGKKIFAADQNSARDLFGRLEYKVYDSDELVFEK